MVKKVTAAKKKIKIHGCLVYALDSIEVQKGKLIN